MNAIFKILAIPVAAVCFAGCKAKPVVPSVISYEIVSVLPHDPEVYTQGLQLKDGRLFESGGHYGQSSVREVDPKTGTVMRKRNLPPEVFAEGLALQANELWVLTWKEKTAFVLDPETFRTLRIHSYEGEGWGLTSDGKQFIMSDGSATLQLRSFKDFAKTGTLEVTENGRPLRGLNELEFIKGEIFANVYRASRVARIDAKSGAVTGWLDLSALRARLPEPNRAEVLNGVAYDEKSGNLLVTGKWWPKMFEVKLR